MSIKPIPKYISISEVAERIGAPESILHDWIHAGRMEAAQLPDGEIGVMENTAKRLPKFVTIPEAAQLIGTTVADLQEWLSDDVNKEKIDAVQLSNGEIVVAETAIADLRPILGEKENLALYQKFEHLGSKPISVSAASRKYNVPHPTISRWSKRGYIKRLGRDGRKVLLDEQDVAYCVAVYEDQNGGRGRQVFYPNGVPHTKQEKIANVAV